MPGELVIARLVIDPSGAQKGIKDSDQALERGKVSLKNFGASQSQVGGSTSLLMDRMFSLKSIVMSLGRAFGIAGVVLMLASALKTLVSDLVNSSSWFQNLKRDVSDWYAEMVKGETLLQRLPARLKELGGSAGISSTLEGIDALKALKKQRDFLINAQMQPETMKSLLALEAIDNDMVSVNQKVAEIYDKLIKAGLSAKRIAQETGVAFVAMAQKLEVLPRGLGYAERLALPIEGKSLPGLSLTPIDDMLRELTGSTTQDALDRLGKLKQGLQALLASGRAGPAFESDVNRIVAAIGNLQDVTGQGLGPEFLDGLYSAEDALWLLGNMKPSFDAQAAWESYLSGIDAATSTTTLKIEAMNAAMSAFSDLAMQSTQGGMTFGKFMAGMLKALAMVLMAFGSALIAKGWLTDSPVYIYQGLAAMAAGLAAGAAASALSRGASSSQAGGGGTRGFNQGGAGGGSRFGSQTIIVNVNGRIDDENAFARKVARLVRTAAADGAA